MDLDRWSTIRYMNGQPAWVLWTRAVIGVVFVLGPAILYGAIWGVVALIVYATTLYLHSQREKTKDPNKPTSSWWGPWT